MPRLSPLLLLVLVVCALLAPARATGPRCGDTPDDDIVENVLDSPIAQLITVDDKIVFLLTESGTVYRTTDGGRSFIPESSKMSGFSVPPSPLLLRPDPGAYWLFQSPVDPKTVFILGNSGYLWVTADGGESYTYFRMPFEAEEILPHPTNEHWLMAFHYNKCCMDPTCYSRCAMELSVSKNFGFNWTRVLQTLPAYSLPSWGLAGQNGRPLETAFAVTWPYPDPPRLLRTSTLFRDAQVVAFNTVEFRYYASVNTIVMAQHTDGQMRVAASLDEGNTVIQSAFPAASNAGAIGSVMFLDVVPGAIMLGIDRRDNFTDRMQLYVSDTFGAPFSMSLSDVKSSRGSIDWERISGLEGVYVANNFATSEGNAMENIEWNTYMSYNKGLTWGTLTPPDNLNCPGCTLNLWGTTDTKGNADPRGRSTALGTVVAIGTVGRTATSSSALYRSSSLFVSHDAGRNWWKAWDGTVNFGLSAYGSLLTIAPSGVITNTIRYSRNMGENFFPCEFAPDPAINETATTTTRRYTVVKIHTDVSRAPDPELVQMRSNVWLETTWIDSQTDATGVTLFWVNLSLALGRCTDADYEPYDPEAGTGNCILGARTTYTRKKPSSICIVDETRVGIANVTECACTLADYSCNFCFIRDKFNNTCVRDLLSPACRNLYDPTPPPARCPPGTLYPAAAPYRRVQGTRCVGELSNLLATRMVPCPDKPLPVDPPPTNVFGGNATPYVTIDKSHDQQLPGKVGADIFSSRTAFIAGFVIAILFIVGLVFIIGWGIVSSRQMLYAPVEDGSSKRVSDSDVHELNA